MSPDVARPLRQVGYAITHVNSESDLGRGASDQRIIEWCARNDYVWITGDRKARTEHAAEILAAGIKVVWIWRPNNRPMSSAATLRVLAFQLPRIIESFTRDENRRYFRIQFAGDPLLEGYRLISTSV